jgi:ATP-binding cassette, subfamily B (MDR/TAP), member 1
MKAPSPASSSNVAVDEKHGLASEETKPPITAGLSEQEKEIIDLQIDAPKLEIGYFALFRYATKIELIIMVIALFASIAAGATMPLMTVGHLFDVT